MGVALLADLGQFQHHVVADEARADGEAFQVEALDDDVLAERPWPTSAPRFLNASICRRAEGSPGGATAQRGRRLDAPVGPKLDDACSVFWIPLISLVHTALITPMMHLLAGDGSCATLDPPGA